MQEKNRFASERGKDGESRVKPLPTVNYRTYQAPRGSSWVGVFGYDKRVSKVPLVRHVDYEFMLTLELASTRELSFKKLDVELLSVVRNHYNTPCMMQMQAAVNPLLEALEGKGKAGDMGLL